MKNTVLIKSQNSNAYLYKLCISQNNIKKAKYYAVVIYWQNYFNRLLSEIEKNDCLINCELYYEEFVRT